MASRKDFPKGLTAVSEKANIGIGRQEVRAVRMSRYVCRVSLER
jgi:hypothetical protein